jgi:hypothetical protein
VTLCLFFLFTVLARLDGDARITDLLHVWLFWLGAALFPEQWGQKFPHHLVDWILLFDGAFFRSGFILFDIFGVLFT